VLEADEDTWVTDEEIEGFSVFGEGFEARMALPVVVVGVLVTPLFPTPPLPPPLLPPTPRAPLAPAGGGAEEEADGGAKFAPPPRSRGVTGFDTLSTPRGVTSPLDFVAVCAEDEDEVTTDTSFEIQFTMIYKKSSLTFISLLSSLLFLSLFLFCCLADLLSLEDIIPS